MTTSQLTKAGITFNSWITLENKYNSILFSNDGYLWIDEKSSQFYFDSANGLVFVRNTFGELTDKPTRSDDISITSKVGSKKFLHVIPGGIDDKTIGKYHYVYSIESISAFI